MNVEIRDDRFRTIIGNALEFEVLESGFAFTEGPIWHPYEKHLTFSDIVGNRQFRWSQEDGLSIYRRESNMANGNTYDREGRMLTCEHAANRVVRTNPDGSLEVLASHYEGKELNSPNDIVVKHDGSIYFTDPTFGRMPYFGKPREPELSHRGVYRIDPVSNTLTLLVDDFKQPNGLAFSVDQTKLYINDSENMHIRVFDVNDDGSLSGGEVWAETVGVTSEIPDGLKVDSVGNVYTTGPGGIQVFTPDATCVGVILVPVLNANFIWGDADLCSLYIPASHTLFRTRTKTPGMKLF